MAMSERTDNPRTKAEVKTEKAHQERGSLNGRSERGRDWVGVLGMEEDKELERMEGTFQNASKSVSLLLQAPERRAARTALPGEIISVIMGLIHHRMK